MGPNYVYYDQVNKRYTKAAECIILSGWEGQYPNDTIDMCQWESYEETVPAFILDSARTKYIESKKKASFTFHFNLRSLDGNRSVYRSIRISILHRLA